MFLNILLHICSTDDYCNSNFTYNAKTTTPKSSPRDPTPAIETSNDKSVVIIIVAVSIAIVVAAVAAVGFIVHKRKTSRGPDRYLPHEELIGEGIGRANMPHNQIPLISLRYIEIHIDAR